MTQYNNNDGMINSNVQQGPQRAGVQVHPTVGSKCNLK